MKSRSDSDGINWAQIFIEIGVMVGIEVLKWIKEMFKERRKSK
jgi:hypothetical protein